MVNCSIDGCQSRVGRDKISFFAIPAVITRQSDMTMELSERRRKIWFERIYRPGFEEADAPRYVRVCANHFVNGKPSGLFDVANADWAPSINLGKLNQGLTKTSRNRRLKTDRKKGLHTALGDSTTLEVCERRESQCIPGIACQTEITCEGFGRLEDMYKKVLEENIALRREIETFKTLARGQAETEEALTSSDYEGPSEKLEVILKTEPEPYPDSDPEPYPDSEPETPPESKTDPLSSDAAPGPSEEDTLRPGEGEDAPQDGNPERKRRKYYQQKRAKRFPCAECGQKFISKQALEIHVRIHTGERPFECPVCQRGFSVRSTLKAHMRTHTGERPFACQMCPRRFSEHGTLKCHMRTHTGERPYECDVCHKKFSENSTLRRHLLVHTGERPFECETCHSKFIQKYNLNNHIKRVHTGTILGL